jgi:acyl-CoA dehydrogenase
MHQHLVAAAVANHRAGRPGAALLEQVGKGELVLVSTGANDWLESNGSAERVSGGWRVTARKPFASGAPAGDLLVTSVACETRGEGMQVLHFAVPFTAEGVSCGDDWQAMGMRGTGSASVTLDGVFVPDEAVVLSRPRGPFHPAFAVILTVALPLIMSAYLGTAEAAARIARDAARNRAGDDTAASLVGEMETRLTAGRLAVEDGVRLANGLDFAPTAEIASAALMRKTLAAEAVLATGELALDVVGGAGFMRRTGLERLVRDLHGARFHPLPAARQRLFSGRTSLGAAPVEDRLPAQRSAA